MYEFKLIPEIVRMGVIAGIVFALQLVIGFDWDAVESWQVWARSAGIGLAQAMAAAMLAVLTQQRVSAE